MKRIRLLNLILPVLAMWSCTDDWNFSASSRYALWFSTDTVRFDTVFTGVASASAEFMIYNPNEVGLRFDALMGGGAASPFRMNLDGEGGNAVCSSIPLLAPSHTHTHTHTHMHTHTQSSY